MFVTCHHSHEVAVMNSTAFNPFAQMFDMAAVLAAHERAGEHAAVTCRVVRPLGDDRLGRMDMAAMETDSCFGTDEDVDDGRFVQA
jgi:hypothetical protein